MLLWARHHRFLAVVRLVHQRADVLCRKHINLANMRGAFGTAFALTSGTR